MISLARVIRFAAKIADTMAIRRCLAPQWRLCGKCVLVISLLLMDGVLLAQERAADGSEAPQSEQPVTIQRGDHISPPRAILTPNPKMPKNGLKGVVPIRCVVGSDGRVRNAEVAKSLSPQNDASAMEVIQKWRFEPAKKDGKPVAVKATVEVAFF
jgi:TonB family protein